MLILKAFVEELIDRRDREMADAAGSGASPLDTPSHLLGLAVLIETLSQVTHRLHKIRTSDAIGIPTFNRLMDEMAAIVNSHVDFEVAEKITREWRQIRFPYSEAFFSFFFRH